MVSEEPKVSDFGRYSIEETSKFLGIHRHTLRRWTEAGKIRCGFRRANKRNFMKAEKSNAFRERIIEIPLLGLKKYIRSI